MRDYRNLLLILVVLAGAVVAVFSPLRQNLVNWTQLGAAIASFGYPGQVMFLVVTALLCAVGMPRLLAYAAGGLAYGFLWGLLLAQVGTMAGSCATFCFARWSGREAVLQRWPQLQRFLNVVEERGIVSVLVLRQIPVSSFFANVLIGLSAISARDFLLGSFIGFLPEGIPAVLLGSGLPGGDLDHIVQLALAVACLLLFLVWLLRFVTGKLMARPLKGVRWPEMWLMTFCGVMGLILYVADGIPVLDMWEPGIRLDVSGIESLPGTDFLLAANDHGHLKGLSGFLVPSMVLVDLEHYPHITPVYLDDVKDTDVSHKKWDAESVRCQLRASGEVLCFMVSGRYRKLLWFSAPSIASVKEGDFALRGQIDIGQVLSMRDPQEIESLVFINQPDEPVRLLLVGRYPELVDGKWSGYPQYIIEFSDNSVSASTVTARRGDELPLSICKSGEGRKAYGDRISELGRIANTQQGILVCTAEHADFSYLVPVRFTATGVVVDADRNAMQIAKSDLHGHAPANLKVEGVTCQQGSVVVSIDSDSDEGGVYRLGSKYSALCQPLASP